MGSSPGLFECCPRQLCVASTSGGKTAFSNSLNASSHLPFAARSAEVKTCMGIYTLLPGHISTMPGMGFPSVTFSCPDFCPPPPIESSSCWLGLGLLSERPKLDLPSLTAGEGHVLLCSGGLWSCGGLWRCWGLGSSTWGGLPSPSSWTGYCWLGSGPG